VQSSDWLNRLYNQARRYAPTNPICERPDSTDYQPLIARVIAQIHIGEEIVPLTPSLTCSQPEHNNGPGPERTRCFSKYFSIYTTGTQGAHNFGLVGSPLVSHSRSVVRNSSLGLQLVIYFFSNRSNRFMTQRESELNRGTQQVRRGSGDCFSIQSPNNSRRPIPTYTRELASTVATSLTAW